MSDKTGKSYGFAKEKGLCEIWSEAIVLMKV